MRIFAPLRNQVFYSLEELNEAMWERLSAHNNMLFQRLNTTRLKLLEEIDLPALKALPAIRYEQKRIEYRTMQFNYYVYLPVDKHYYSVPYQYRGKKVKIKYTARDVEISFNNVRLAFYMRDTKPGGYTTKKEHMPSSHKFYAQWSPERFLNWSREQGEYVEHVIAKVLAERQHPEQAFRSCLGILTLEKKYGRDRVNQACKRAIQYGSYNYTAIKNILDKGLDKLVVLVGGKQQNLPFHENIRGSEYFKMEATGE